MALKIPSVITKKWIEENCHCIRRKDHPTWLTCVESCDVHNSVDEALNDVRDEIAEVTKKMGLRLDWYMDQPMSKEKRP
jgi:hypothetical protein